MKKGIRLFIMASLIILLLVPQIWAAGSGNEKPQYGGTLTILEMYPGLNALSWDNATWIWKIPYDTGFYVDHLLVGDFKKGPRGSKQYDFADNGWIPPQFLKGELAEKWEVKKNPLQVIFHLRQGVMWQDKPGVMKARELVADDVAYSMNRILKSPKAIPGYLDFIDRWEAKDKYTVVMYLKEWMGDWEFKVGYGYYDGIQPPEQERAAGGPNKWENACGTGPYLITDYKEGHSQIYSKNPKYWDWETISGQKYQLPFTDKVVMMIIKDEATQLASLRTGKVDLMMNINWKYKDELAKSIPQLKWQKQLYGVNWTIALRMDRKPFSDIRVRRAMNLAVNKKEIIDSFFKGNAFLHTFPFPPTFGDIYTPVEKLPPQIKELYGYNPEKAKKLLAEAGYPNGFSFKLPIQNTTPTELDLAAMVAAYLAKIGVTMELEPMDYPSSLSMMMKKTHTAAFFHAMGPGGTINGIERLFLTGVTWNASMMSDPYVDKTWKELASNPNLTPKQLTTGVRQLTVYCLDQVPHIILPHPYSYIAWWPWVKNYYGERRLSATRSGPIMAHIWIDQELKKKMGF